MERLEEKEEPADQTENDLDAPRCEAKDEEGRAQPKYLCSAFTLRRTKELGHLIAEPDHSGGCSMNGAFRILTAVLRSLVDYRRVHHSHSAFHGRTRHHDPAALVSGHRTERSYVGLLVLHALLVTPGAGLR